MEFKHASFGFEKNDLTIKLIIYFDLYIPGYQKKASIHKHHVCLNV